MTQLEVLRIHIKLMTYKIHLLYQCTNSFLHLDVRLLYIYYIVNILYIHCAWHFECACRCTCTCVLVPKINTCTCIYSRVHVYVHVPSSVQYMYMYTVPVRVAIRSQCLSFIALLAINSRSGQVSLKSSIFFFRSLKACHSFKPLGSLRHRFWNSTKSVLIFSVSTYRYLKNNDVQYHICKLQTLLIYIQKMLAAVYMYMLHIICCFENCIHAGCCIHVHVHVNQYGMIAYTVQVHVQCRICVGQHLRFCICAGHVIC